MWPFGYHSRYPYTDFHELNADWILEKIRGLEGAMSSFVQNWSNPITVSSYQDFADPKLIYLYVGDEIGYVKNHWYYYDQDTSTWTDGGLYGSAVVDTAFSHTSGNAVKNKTITDFLNPDAQKAYSTLFSVNDAVLYAPTVYTPEMFGAAGDGVTDDSAAIKDCIDTAVSDGATVAMYGNYKVSNPITCDADSNKCNILVYGYIIADAQITLEGIINSNVLIKLKDGGLGNTQNACVNIYAGGYNNITLFANDVNGLAYQIGGSSAAGTMSNFNNVEVYGFTNMQTLRHGDGNNKQWAFGTYTNIYDYKPTEPVQFKKSNDITILHIENLFDDSTHTKNSIEFDDCDLINIESLALGGTAQYLGYMKDSRIHINYLFVNSEDPAGSRVTEGLYITGKSVVHIDFTTAGNCPHAVIVDSLSNEAGANWRPQVYMQNGYVYNPTTDQILDASNANSTRIGCFDQQIAPNKVHANIDSWTGGYIRIGKMVFISMKVVLSAEISESSFQILFDQLPPHATNFATDINLSSSAQMFSAAKLGESSGSLYLPAGQTMTAGTNYITGSYIAMT